MRCVFANTNLKLIKNTLIRKQVAVGILSCNITIDVCSPKRTKEEMEEKLAFWLQAGLHSCTNPIAYREGCYLATGGYYEEMRILAHTIAQTFRRRCSEHSQTITFSGVKTDLNSARYCFWWNEQFSIGANAGKGSNWTFVTVSNTIVSPGIEVQLFAKKKVVWA